MTLSQACQLIRSPLGRMKRIGSSFLPSALAFDDPRMFTLCVFPEEDHDLLRGAFEIALYFLSLFLCVISVIAEGLSVSPSPLGEVSLPRLSGPSVLCS